MNIDVKEIVKKYLEENGYDGLYDDDCGCELSDLFPCSGWNDCMDSCKAGYKIPCDSKTCSADGDCEWHMGSKP